MGHWDRRPGGREPQWSAWASKHRSELPARAFAYAKGDVKKLPHHWLDRSGILWAHPQGVAAAHRMVSRTDIAEAAKTAATKHLDRHLRILGGDAITRAKEATVRYLFSGKKEMQLTPETHGSDASPRRSAVDSIEVSLDWKDVEEIDGVAWFRDVTLSKEMVQDYGDVKVLKCTDELSAAVPFMDLRPITLDHPALQIVTHRDEICGHLENAKMVDASLVADLAITCDPLKEDIKSSRRRDVSIGFHADWDATPGKLGDVEYDVVQRNILIDHVAVVENGRCSVEEGCGITMEVLEVAGDGTVSGVITAETRLSSDALNMKWIVEYAIERLMARYVEGKVLEGAMTPLFATANEAIGTVVTEAVERMKHSTDALGGEPFTSLPAEIQAIGTEAKTARDALETQLTAFKESLEKLTDIVGPGFGVHDGSDPDDSARAKVNEAYRAAFSPDVSV